MFRWRRPPRNVSLVTAATDPAIDDACLLEVLRARPASPMPYDRPWGWLGPLLVTAFGAFLRI